MRPVPKAPGTRLGFLFAALLALGGCAMSGDSGSSSGSTPKNVDAVHMQNGDVLVGELGLSKVEIEVDYLQNKVSIEPRHIESLEFLASGKTKVVTRHGDVLQGASGIASLRLRTKTGSDVVLAPKDIRRITFAE